MSDTCTKPTCATCKDTGYVDEAMPGEAPSLGRDGEERPISAPCPDCSPPTEAPAPAAPSDAHEAYVEYLKVKHGMNDVAARRTLEAERGYGEDLPLFEAGYAAARVPGPDSFGG